MDSYVSVNGSSLRFSCTGCLPGGVHSATLWHGITSINGGAGLTFTIYVCEVRDIEGNRSVVIDLSTQSDLLSVELIDF